MVKIVEYRGKTKGKVQGEREEREPSRYDRTVGTVNSLRDPKPAPWARRVSRPDEYRRRLSGCGGVPHVSIPVYLARKYGWQMGDDMTVTYGVDALGEGYVTIRKRRT